MAYTAREPYIVEQAIADNSTTQKHDLGTVVRAYDSTYGQGEFIYLKGVASTVVGSIVTYNVSFQSALSTAALLSGKPVAVAMSACVANEYGWYQISGEAVAFKSASVSLVAGADVGTTAGKAIIVVTGLNLDGASVAYLASATTTVTSVRLMLNRPNETGSQDEG